MKLKTINEYQKNIYKSFDVNGCKRYLLRYQNYLERFSDKKGLKILDIGGGSGYFAFTIKEHFSEANPEVYVVDSASYDSWSSDCLGKDVHFICDSVENLNQLFENNTFDIVFANRTFHHFIDSSWKKSLHGMSNYLNSINNILKPDGALLIMDHFYDGLIFDTAASFLIYTATSIKNPVLSKFVKKMGGESAGVGVCFQSEKMWKTRIENAGFFIETIEKRKPDKLNTIKKLVLLIKNARRDNIILAIPQK